ncbi:MAG TPA: succinyl-diaminopimelate desuccinylase [Acidimicrobiales bacterium]|nr:succinyl-diaminopimelate desuccinylase [Acidimicrobiales bacterium]
MTDLLAATTDLVALPSLSHEERALADLVERRLRACDWLQVTRVGDNVVGRTALGRSQRLVLAGHIDTVPPAGNAQPKVEGDTLWGVGASDMKGGLAVMLDLAAGTPEPTMDLTWCFYACEEVGRADSGLLQLWNERPDLLEGDAAILGEPTSALVEAGCQGTMRFVITLTGVRAHTARPFTGRNAIHRLASVLRTAAEWESRTVEIDGCTYAEQLQVVAVSGGVAPNVVPDVASATLNLRFAPDRRAAEAEAVMRALFGLTFDEAAGDTFVVVDAADGAPPSLEHPLLASLVARSADPPRAKVGWTDVASFFEHGVPAANFGPGDPLLAHHPDEHVTRAQLERARDVLAALITSEAWTAPRRSGERTR